ncbi:MAG: SAF domain-containing protein [Ilumatobacter sp.]
MTSTIERPIERPITDASAEAPIVSLTPPTRRRPSWVVAGVLLVGLAALLGASVFSSATDTLRVTVANGDLAPGDVIDPSDLRVVEMGRTGGLRAILADQQSLVIGQTPRAVIPEGTLLNTGLFVSPEEVVPVGYAVVGAAFSAGEIATPSLGIGDRVELVVVRRQALTGTPNDDQPAEATVLGAATIWDLVGEASTGGASERVWVSLLVDRELQTRVAQAASGEVLRLTLVAG